MKTFPINKKPTCNSVTTKVKITEHNDFHFMSVWGKMV